MNQTQILMIAAALLIAAVMLPVKPAARTFLFLLLMGFLLLSEVGAGLGSVTTLFD